jgi:hypothetical protein
MKIMYYNILVAIWVRISNYVWVNMTFFPRIVSFKGSELLVIPIILKS